MIRSEQSELGTNTHGHPVAIVVTIGKVRIRIREVVGEATSQVVRELHRKSDIGIQQLFILIAGSNNWTANKTAIFKRGRNVIKTTEEGQGLRDAVVAGNSQTEGLALVVVDVADAHNLNRVIWLDAVASEGANSELAVDL